MSDYNGATIQTMNGLTTLIDTTIMNSFAIYNISQGGAVFVNSGQVEVLRNYWANNTAGFTGGLHVLFSSTVTIKDSVIESNKAHNFSGGALNFAASGTYNITNTQFTYCECGTRGGAIHASAGQITLTNVTIEHCEAKGTDGGGAIMLTQSSPHIDVIGCTFKHNKALRGGTFSVIGGFLNIYNSSIEYGKATVGGGGIWDSAGTINIRDATTFKYCSSNVGGAIYQFSGNLSVDSTSIIQDGFASTSGGCIYTAGGYMTLDHNLITNCTSLSGGAIHVFGGNLEMDGGSISESSALTGDGGCVKSQAGVFAQHP